MKVENGVTCSLLPRISPVDGFAREALIVSLGAIPGAWLRLRIVNHFEPMVPRKHWGTFLINVVACFGLGLVGALYQDCTNSTGLMLLIGVGFFGSLSTFSTFTVELLNELRLGHGLAALVLAAGSILVGLVAAGVGYGIGTVGTYG